MVNKLRWGGGGGEAVSINVSSVLWFIQIIQTSLELTHVSSVLWFIQIIHTSLELTHVSSVLWFIQIIHTSLELTQLFRRYCVSYK